MLTTFLYKFNQFVCAHKALAKKRRPIEGSDLYQLYTSCLDCGKESPGIETGGFHYGGIDAA